MNCKYIAEYEHVKIRAVNTEDIELLRKWRNDKEVSRFLRPIGEITQEMQMKWYEEYLKDDNIIQFAIEEVNELHRVVGSVAIYNFEGTTAEVGKIIVGDPEAKGKKVGFYALALAMGVGFEKMGIEQYHLSVHEDNVAAKKNYINGGFKEVGQHKFELGGNELEMKVSKAEFYLANPFWKDAHLFMEAACEE